MGVFPQLDTDVTELATAEGELSKAMHGGTHGSGHRTYVADDDWRMTQGVPRLIHPASGELSNTGKVMCCGQFDKWLAMK